MNTELLLLIKKTYTYVDWTDKDKTSGDSGIQNESTNANFSFTPPINLVEEDKWLLGVT